jgi:hypothetical protein
MSNRIMPSSVGNVVNLRQLKAKSTIAVLQQLLEKAERGEVDGLLFAFSGPGHEPRIGVSGYFSDHPTRALAVAERMRHRINMVIDEEGEEL